MRFSLLFFTILIIAVACSKDKDPLDEIDKKANTLRPFTVTVVERAPNTAIITWTEALNIYNSDTVKYDIVLNGKTVRTDHLKMTDTLKGLSPDSLYTGRVFAKTRSGDTASAAFELEKIDGYLVYGDWEGTLYSINLYTGTVLWKTAPVYSRYKFAGVPAIVNNVIYMNAGKYGTFAIDAKTGQQIWNNTFNLTTYDNSWSLIFLNGKIYTNTGDKIYSLNSLNGQSIWSFSEVNDTYIGSPVAGNNLLFTIAYDKGYGSQYGTNKRIVAIDLNTGTKAWEYNAGSYLCENPVVYNGLVIFGASDGKIYALNQATGKLAWMRDFSVTYNNFGSDLISPKIYNNLVIVNSGNSGYYGLNAATGGTVWNYQVPINSQVSSPAIGNKLVYFSAGITPCKAIALDAATGVKVWEYTFTPNYAYPTPIFAKNRLYFATVVTDGFDIPVLDAVKGKFIVNLQLLGKQFSSASVVVSDTTYYLSQSGMMQ